MSPHSDPLPLIRTKGQEAFVEQMTRKLLVEWCAMALRQGTVPEDPSVSVYLAHAVAKKWISAPQGGSYRILSTGWDTAARFLKR